MRKSIKKNLRNNKNKHIAHLWGETIKKKRDAFIDKWKKTPTEDKQPSPDIAAISESMQNLHLERKAEVKEKEEKLTLAQEREKEREEEKQEIIKRISELKKQKQEFEKKMQEPSLSEDYIADIAEDIENIDDELKTSEAALIQIGKIGKIGDGKNKKDLGMSNFDIIKVMKRYKNKFLGVFSRDEIPREIIKRIKPNQKTPFGFIYNTSPESKPGEHWRAIYIDAGPKSQICYFDSFGEEPKYQIRRDMTKIIQYLNPETYLKEKVNKLKMQNAKSSNCGEFSIWFLTEMFRPNSSFSKITGFDNKIKEVSGKGEKMIEKFKKQYPIFKTLNI